MKLYVWICIASSLISAVGVAFFEAWVWIAALYALCVAASFWGRRIYPWLLVATLTLAMFNVVRMFPSHWEWGVSLTIAGGTIRPVNVDPRPLMYLIPFVILSYPRLKADVVRWLNAGEDDEKN